MEIEKEEIKDIVDYETIKNDGKIETMKKLIDIKNIFARQLPKMPKEYIIRLIFDKKHECIVIKYNGKVFGGVCYCVFERTKMVEIVFLAIMSDHQIRGFGTKLMNHLKMELQKRKIHFLMTCADNLAIGYFKKQGFHKEILMDEKLYKGYLKDYEGSTLMECILVEDINYRTIMEDVRNQKNLLKEYLKTKINNHKVHPRIPEKKWANLIKEKKKNQETLMNIKNIPGISQSKYEQKEIEALKEKEKGTTFRNSCKTIIEQILQHKSVWPFKQAVKKEDVPDYYDIIKEPIDFSTIKKRLDTDNYYTTKNKFVQEVKLVFKNAKKYNQPQTIYYKCAQDLENYSNNILINLKEEGEFDDKNENFNKERDFKEESAN